MSNETDNKVHSRIVIRSDDKVIGTNANATFNVQLYVPQPYNEKGYALKLKNLVLSVDPIEPFEGSILECRIIAGDVKTGFDTLFNNISYNNCFFANTSIGNSSTTPGAVIGLSLTQAELGALIPIGIKDTNQITVQLYAYTGGAAGWTFLQLADGSEIGNWAGIWEIIKI